MVNMETLTREFWKAVKKLSEAGTVLHRTGTTPYDAFFSLSDPEKASSRNRPEIRHIIWAADNRG